MSAQWLRGIVCLIGIAFGVFVSAGTVAQAAAGPEYSIEAIRYATAANVPLAEFLVGISPEQGKQKIDAAFVVWVVRGGGHTILVDSGFHRETFSKDFGVKDYLRPDEAVKLAGVEPDQITDIVITHAHWDHMGGIDLFPKAQVWIQKDEFGYYTGAAWQPGGDHGGIDPEDVAELVRLNTEGRLHLVDGDDVEILPGILAYTGSRHTFASQYLLIGGAKPYVLASDNLYLYRNLAEHRASATFSDADHEANIAQQARMVKLAGSLDRVVPGHDMLQFERFPTQGRVAKIR